MKVVYKIFGDDSNSECIINPVLISPNDLLTGLFWCSVFSPLDSLVDDTDIFAAVYDRYNRFVCYIILAADLSDAMCFEYEYYSDYELINRAFEEEIAFLKEDSCEGN